MNKMAASILLVFSACWSSLLWAEACSYREALIAYQQGNLVRAQALMKMAANDGDPRAKEFLHTNVKTELVANREKANRKNANRKVALAH